MFIGACAIFSFSIELISLFYHALSCSCYVNCMQLTSLLCIQATVYSSNFEYEPIIEMKDLDKRFGPLLSIAEARIWPRIDHVSAFL